MSNIRASKPIPTPSELNAKLQAKILTLENKILRLENKTLKYEQRMLKLVDENTKLKAVKHPVNIAINLNEEPKKD